MARRAKKYDKAGNYVYRPHDDCFRTNYDDNDAVRLCYDGLRGDHRFHGWQYCSRGPHCAPAGDFVRAGIPGFMVCRRHNEQSYDTKNKKTGKSSKTRTTKPVARGPRNKTTGTATGRVSKQVTPKKPTAAARIRTPASADKKRGKKIREGEEALFVGSDEDMDEDEEDEEDEDELYEKPTSHRRRTPEPDNDGSGGMGGGMGALSALIAA